MEGSRPSSTSSPRAHRARPRGDSPSRPKAPIRAASGHPRAADWQTTSAPQRSGSGVTYQPACIASCFAGSASSTSSTPYRVSREWPSRACSGWPVPCVATVQLAAIDKQGAHLPPGGRPGARIGRDQPDPEGPGPGNRWRGVVHNAVRIEDFETAFEKERLPGRAGPDHPRQGPAPRGRGGRARRLPWSWPARSTATRPRGATSRS